MIEFPSAKLGMADLKGNQNGKLNGIIKNIVPIGSSIILLLWASVFTLLTYNNFSKFSA